MEFVGVVPEPIAAPVFPMLVGQKSVSASLLGSPAPTAKLLELCVRHGIAPVTEEFPMSRVNGVIEMWRPARPATGLC